MIPPSSCLSGDFRQRAFVLDLYWRFPQWEDIRDILVNVNYLCHWRFYLFLKYVGTLNRLIMVNLADECPKNNSKKVPCTQRQNQNKTKKERNISLWKITGYFLLGSHCLYRAIRVLLASLSLISHSSDFIHIPCSILRWMAWIREMPWSMIRKAFAHEHSDMFLEGLNSCP